MRLPRGEVDASDPIWEERVSAYFDGVNGLPAAGDPSEYAVAFEAVFPDAADRRSYIEAAIRKGSPAYGHRVLASLITSGLVRGLFTTNFDPLIERTVVLTDELVPADQRAHLTVGALDAVERAVRCVRDETWPVLVKLHGDYQSEQLKNTSSELQAQDEQLRQTLVEVSSKSGLIVVGYSGRDDSIMDALDEAVALPGAMSAGLWWVARAESRPFPRVISLLERAEAAGIEARVVESENFDELCGDIERQVELIDVLRSYVSGFRARPLVSLVALPTIAASTFPAVRCSAVEVLRMPSQASKVVLDRNLTTEEARQLVRDSGAHCTVSSRGLALAAFGQDEELEAALASVGGRISGVVPIDPEATPPISASSTTRSSERSRGGGHCARSSVAKDTKSSCALLTHPVMTLMHCPIVDSCPISGPPTGQISRAWSRGATARFPKR